MDRPEDHTPLERTTVHEIERTTVHEDNRRSQPRRPPIVAGVPVRTIATTIAMVLITIATLWLASKVTRILTWLVVSTFFTVVLTPPVDRLHRKLKMPRALATSVVFIGGIIVLVAMLYSFIRPIVDQTTKFSDEFPTYVAKAQNGEGSVGKLVKKYKVEQWVKDNQERWRSSVDELGRNALTVVRSVFNTLAATLTIAVLTFLMLLQGPELLYGMVRVLSPPQQERARHIGRQSAKAITGYVAGNLAISVIAGVGTWMMLLAAGVPFAGVLALWVGFADLIPLVGATLGAIPTVGVAFLHSVPAGIAVLIFYVVYQQLENHILQPNIMSKTVSLRPLIVLITVLMGVELFGLMGALLAIPAAGVIKVVGTEILRWRRPELGFGNAQRTSATARRPRLALPWARRSAPE